MTLIVIAISQSVKIILPHQRHEIAVEVEEAARSRGWEKSVDIRGRLAETHRRAADIAVLGPYLTHNAEAELKP